MPCIDLEKFYGRKDILALLKKRVLDFKDGYRQNAALLGDRYIGKSIILRKFLSTLDDPSIVPVYVDLEHKDLRYFCLKISGSLLYEFSRRHDLPRYEDINLLIEQTRAQLPETIKAIQKMQTLLRQDKEFAAYQLAVALPQVFSRESGLVCVLAFDEFHYLEEWDFPDVFQELGKLIMTQRQCYYLFASSQIEAAKKILSEKLSLLFGNFETIAVEPFDTRTCCDFMTYHLGGVEISPSLRDFLIDLTGGHPLYLRLLCSEIHSLCSSLDQKEAFLPILSRAVENTIFDSWGTLSRHFDLILEQTCSGRGNLINARILLILSRGRHTVKTLAELAGVKQRALSTRLKKMAQAGLVSKNGKLYYLPDRLFRYWLSFVFKRRLVAIDLSPDRRREQFREEFARSVEIFRQNSDKTVSVRIMDLMQCFEDELLHINGRRYHLPLFSRIRPGTLDRSQCCGLDIIEADTAAGSWLIVLKRKRVSEQDISVISGAVKERQVRPQRCILVSFERLDEEARVRALQERMWIWNEGELRTLLDVYDQPLIVA
ncbi:MAG: ArsR family transcriptional regulator [Candidatus Omnitrophota bacterium]